MTRLLPSHSLDAWHGPSFVSRCLPAWIPGLICLPLSPFICLPLSPILDAWHGSGWTGSFVSLCILCLPSFISRCLPAWMPGWTASFVSLCLPLFVLRCLPGTGVWVDGFIVSLCLPSFASRSLPSSISSMGLARAAAVSALRTLPGSLDLPATSGSPRPRRGAGPASPKICTITQSVSVKSSRSSLGGRVHLSCFVSLHLSPVAWHGSLGGRVYCLHLARIHLSSFVSQPECLAQLAGWADSFVSPCLPSFVSRCRAAWMPGTALRVDGFICLWTTSVVFRCLPDCSFVSLVSRCSQPGMPGTVLRVDGFICLPLSPFLFSRLLRGVFRRQACVFEAQKRVSEPHALDQATGFKCVCVLGVFQLTTSFQVNTYLLPLSSHAVTMECDLSDKRETNRLRQEGRDALYRAYGRIGFCISLRKQMLY